uniref:UDP-N-acetylglucosamine transferase subunit ALG14 n=1 Tax=Ursus americanus TaxID=9643 RepID=A0A452R247_URSAM
MASVLILAAAGAAVAALLALRLWVVLHPRVLVPRQSLSLLVVAGSGGHTTEILRLLENLSNAYSPRHYIIADTDEMSAHKINSFELNRADRDPSTMRVENLENTMVIFFTQVEYIITNCYCFQHKEWVSFYPIISVYIFFFLKVHPIRGSSFNLAYILNISLRVHQHMYCLFAEFCGLMEHLEDCYI